MSTVSRRGCDELTFTLQNENSYIKDTYTGRQDNRENSQEKFLQRTEQTTVNAETDLHIPSIRTLTLLTGRESAGPLRNTHYPH